MNLKQKKLFVKCWKAEYKATSMINSLQARSDTAYRYDRPTARLERSINTWREKQNKACDPIIELIQNGLIGEDAVILCDELLGDLGGYVADCYHCFWEEYKPK